MKLHEDNTISHSDFCELAYLIGSNYDEISSETCLHGFYGHDGEGFIEVYRIWPGCECDEDGKPYSHSSSEKINQLVDEIFKHNDRISSFKILN